MGKKYEKPAYLGLPTSDQKSQKFINYIMKEGKRTVALKIFNDTMAEIKANGHLNPNAVLEAALENAAPGRSFTLPPRTSTTLCS